MSNAFTEAPLPGKDEMRREDSLKWSQSYVKVDKPHLTLPKQKPRREIIFTRDIDETRDDYILNEFQKESIMVLDNIIRRYDSIDYMSRQARNYFKTQIEATPQLGTNSAFIAPLTPMEIQVLKSQIDRYDATLLTDTASIIKILRTGELVKYVLQRSKMVNLTPEKKRWYDLFKKIATDIAIKNRLFQIDWTMTPEQYDAVQASQSQSGNVMSGSGGFPSGSVGGAPVAGMSGSGGFPIGYPGASPQSSAGAGFAPGASGVMGGGDAGGDAGGSGSNVPPGFQPRADDADQNPHPGQQQPASSATGQNPPPSSVIPNTTKPDTADSNIPSGSFEDMLANGFGIEGYLCNDSVAIGSLTVSRPDIRIKDISPPLYNVGAMLVSGLGLGTSRFYFCKQSDIGNRRIIGWDEAIKMSPVGAFPIAGAVPLRYMQDVNIVYNSQLYGARLTPFVAGTSGIDTAASLMPSRGRTPTGGSGAPDAGAAATAGAAADAAAAAGASSAAAATAGAAAAAAAAAGAIGAGIAGAAAAGAATRSPTTGAPTTGSPTTGSPTGAPTADPRTSIKATIIQIIKSSPDSDTATQKVYEFLDQKGIIPDSAHQILLQELAEAQPSGGRRLLSDVGDMSQTWIIIRKVLLETKVLTEAEVIEIRQAMDDLKIAKNETPPNPASGSQNTTPTTNMTDDFFTEGDTFGDSVYDFSYAIFTSLLHYAGEPLVGANQGNWNETGDYITFIRAVMYVPNSWTFHWIGAIVQSVGNNLANFIKFSNTVGAFFSIVKMGNGSVYDWSKVALGNLMALFFWEALGKGGNNLLRILYYAFVRRNINVDWGTVLPAWYMVLIWCFFGGLGGDPKLTTSEIATRATRVGVIGINKWFNLLYNSFIFVNEQNPGNLNPQVLAYTIIDQLRGNAVFQIVDWMSKDFDRLQIQPDQNVVQAVEQAIPEAVIQQQDPLVGYNDGTTQSDATGTKSDQTQTDRTRTGNQESQTTSASTQRTNSGAQGSTGRVIQPTEQGGTVENSNPRQPTEQSGSVSDNRPKPASQDTGTEAGQQQAPPSTTVSDATMTASQGSQAPGYQMVTERYVTSDTPGRLLSNNPYMFLNQRSLSFVNTWGISGRSGDIATIFTYTMRVVQIYNNLGAPPSRRDPTASGFIEFMGTGETPTLILIIRSVYAMFKVSMADDLARLGVLDVGDIMIRQYGNQQFTQEDQLEYARKYGKFFYFCLSQLMARGIVQNDTLLQNQDPGAISVRKTARFLSMMLEFFNSLGAMGQYYNTRLAYDVLSRM